jgi:hypothetical protein
MIAKVQPSKQKSRSSFKRLLNYLTKEVDPETGETLLRGEAVLSNNLAGIDTAAAEMKAVESLNLRCDDAVCHYELAWPPGERPTRAQWIDAAEYTLDQLGYEDHQYVVVAHDDKKHFHIHIMLNKVHPETYKAHTPYRNWITLDAAMRTLEAKYVWSHTVGPTRWDEATQKAVRTSRSERNESRSNQNQAIGAAARYEHYHDEESLQTYVRREVAPRVRTLLTRRNVSWDALHTLLAKYHLRMEKGEAGGYTVLAIDHTIRVKASDVFRHNFAGKENRKATEQALGPWIELPTSLPPAAANTGRTSVRNQAQREERREQRLRDRNALMAEYNQYRNQQRAVCKGITAKGRDDRQRALSGLKQRKKEIRALAQPWPAKKILLSEAVAAFVIELRMLKSSTQKTRQAQFPKNLRTWVAECAAEGDARAAAQLRGWRYADQRNQRRLESSLEANALHLGPATVEEKTDWSELMQERLAAQQPAENLVGQIATARIWTINRTTGDVSYILNGNQRWLPNAEGVHHPPVRSRNRIVLLIRELRRESNGLARRLRQRHIFRRLPARRNFHSKSHARGSRANLRTNPSSGALLQSFLKRRKRILVRGNHLLFRRRGPPIQHHSATSRRARTHNQTRRALLREPAKGARTHRK